MQDYAIKYKCTYPNSCPPISQLQTLYNSGSIMHVISFQQKSRNGLKTLHLEITWKRIIVVEEWFHSRLYNKFHELKSRSRSTNCVRGSSGQHQICMFATRTAHPNLCNTDFNQGIQYKLRKLKTKPLNGMYTL